MAEGREAAARRLADQALAPYGDLIARPEREVMLAILIDDLLVSTEDREDLRSVMLLVSFFRAETDADAVPLAAGFQEVRHGVLAAAVAQLSELERAVVHAFYAEGKRHSDFASERNLSLGTVSRIHRRAKRRLAKSLMGRGERRSVTKG